jgi:hypothetical protein
VTAFGLAGCQSSSGGTGGGAIAPSTRYEDLTQLFTEWRTFQQPKRTDGVPDYTPAAMTAQFRALAGLQQRLRAIDPTGWPVAQQVDFHLVRAEMNGLDFDHRVLKPWERNPAFYVTIFSDQSDQPAREGPLAWGGVELWSYRYPLSDQDAAEIKTGLERIPLLLAEARTNLTGTAKDLWTYGAKSLQQQSAELTAFEAKLKGATPGLLPAIASARAASDSLAQWVAAQAETKTAGSGIGIDNYNWYLRNVQLLPYTWSDEVALMRRELARAHAFLRLEEERNRKLPQQVPVASEAEHARRFAAGLKQYLAFLADHQVMTMADYLEPALRAKLGSFTPGPRDFFTEVDYRDPEVMRTHGYHWFDLARLKHDPPASRIRRVPLLYNIFDSRTEGFATGWEEMMLQAGMFDANPRSRELVYVLLGQRAARALGDLMMHANLMTLEEAAKFAAANTPRGWLRETAATVWFEQHLYLQQPAYGTSYLIGKIEAEKLLRDRANQLGPQFTMKRFMDEFNAVGLVPISMVRWELAGPSPDITDLLAGR